jgi:hypothetical protein
MPRWLRVSLVAIVVLIALTVTTLGSARPRVPGTMHLTVNIYATGTDEAAMPGNIAVRAGGTVTITFRNHTALFHTFTIRALGISALIRPATAGAAVRVSSVTFVAPYGVYEWRCVFCASTAHPHMHAMKGKVYAIIAA